MFRYAKANNRYMKNYNENKHSSSLKYLDKNNYGYVSEINCKWIQMGKTY